MLESTGGPRAYSADMADTRAGGRTAVDNPANTGIFFVQRIPIDSIDGLRQPISDADLEIVQLAGGEGKGSLTSVVFPKLAFGRADFSLPLRTTGVLGNTNVTLSMELSGGNSSWGRALNSGDVYSTAPGESVDTAAVIGIQGAGLSISAENLASHFASEGILAEIGYWQQNHQYACDPRLRSSLTKRVVEISRWLEGKTALSHDAADFWQRRLIEAFTSTVIGSLASNDARPIPSALKLVREAEHYLSVHLNRAVHISEICAALNISRRTLHRAFHDVLGMGPIAFLRHHRLCAVHSMLRRCDPSNTHVTNVATEFGFFDFGRFAHYYASLFGEYPSQTLRKTSSSELHAYRRFRS